MAAYFDSPAPLLPEILALHGKWRADKPAVIYGSHTLNWNTFLERITRVANGLLNAGLQPGDRVAVLMSNQLETVETLFGIMAAGCVSVPINLSVTNSAANNMLRDSSALAMFITSDQQSRFESGEFDAFRSMKLLITTGEAEKVVPGKANWLDFETYANRESSEPSSVSIGDEDYLNIIYSSGTTGQPKGIVHTHRGRRDWAYDLAIALRYHGNARTLLTLGLYSNISWVAMLCTVLAGGTLIVQRQFDAGEFLRAVEDFGVTHTAMVPIQFQRVLEHPQCAGANLSSMHAMMSCGSPLFAELKQRVFKRFSCGIIELYGLTEGIITTLEPEEAEGRWQSVGKPLLGTDIRIIDTDDQELPSGQAGEIVSRGRITMPEYFNQKIATEEACWFDSEGRRWLRSGDIGVLDEQGYLSIVDRKKDMIVSGGQNIFPQDIEAVLLEHDSVSEVAVIGVSSQKWGETPLALVVAGSESVATESEILAWSNERLGRQQRLADLQFIPELPRNPNGKILKRELRQQFEHRLFA